MVRQSSIGFAVIALLATVLGTSSYADELIVLTVAGSYAARLRSYELLAEAFELNKQNP